MLKPIRVIGSLFVIAVLMLSGSLLPGHPDAAADDENNFETFSPELAGQLAEIYEQKLALTPTQQKIDSALLDITHKIEKQISLSPRGKITKLEDFSTPLVKLNEAGGVEVKLTVTSLTTEQEKQLEDLGMDIRLTLPKYGIVEGSLPYDRIEAVAGLDFVTNVGTPGYALHNTGDVNSEGDTVLRADAARSTYGVDGSGIKVGVMSDGVSHLANSEATGDLPSVQVLQPGNGDEGTAMLEIVHDLAPGSPLAFYGPDPSDSGDMVTGIGALESEGCKIIVDDLTYSDEPKFEDGPIAREARDFVTRGGVYVTSAGNNAQRHYIHQYVQKAGPFVGGIYPYAHDYGSGDIGNTFTVPNNVSIITTLQWNNQLGSSSDDFDLFLVDSFSGSIITWSDNPQTGTGNPWEGLGWTNNTGGSVSVYIAVLEYSLSSAPNSLMLDYNVWYGSGLQYSMPENSVIGHSAVEEVLSTAAAAAATPTTIESFSSQGPGTIYFPSQQDRQLPNVTGVDGVQTKTGQLGFFLSNPFLGTSAAAPHVAAIAALVWDASPTLTPSQVRSAITSTAINIGTSGYDYISGFGRVDAYDAVNSVLAISVTTNAATSITNNSTTLNGNLSSLGEYSSANVSFEWGTAPGALSNTTANQTKTSTGAFTDNLTSLSPSTTYYFRAKATAGSDTVHGNTANFTTLKQLTSIAITPDSPSILAGLTQQFTATGNYTDMSTENITASVTWTSDNLTVATIGEHNGLAQSLAAGTTTITAALGATSNTTLLTVNPSRILTMAVIGSGSTDPAAGSHYYLYNSTVNITATPADGWRFVNWSGVVSDNSSANTTVLLDSNKTVTATFSQWLFGRWQTETVDSTDNVGEFTSLAIDSNNHPHISYFDRTNNQLKYASFNGISWSTETVDSGGTGEFSSLALDNQDYPHISYCDYTNNKLRYASYNGTAWNTDNVDSIAIGWGTSLALDSSYHPHIGYSVFTTNNILKYVSNDGNSWQAAEIVDSTDNVGGYCSLALDDSNVPHISYFDSH